MGQVPDLGGKSLRVTPAGNGVGGLAPQLDPLRSHPEHPLGPESRRVLTSQPHEPAPAVVGAVGVDRPAQQLPVPVAFVQQEPGGHGDGRVADVVKQALVLVLALGGLRFGEATELRRSDVPSTGC
jgi:hypothetical protein